MKYSSDDNEQDTVFMRIQELEEVLMHGTVSKFETEAIKDELETLYAELEDVSDFDLDDSVDEIF